MQDDRPPLRLTIGELARRVGVPVRTVRYWSDAGLIDPAGRTAAGYRRYDADAVLRLDLVRTLRELGLPMAAVRDLLARQSTLADVAATHVAALDGELRLLRLRRALLHYLATTPLTDLKELTVITDLARMSARERQQLIDEFVGRAFAGLPSDAPGSGIATAMRTLPAELPDDPTSDQVNAWLELGELVQDPDFAARVRQMAVAGAAAPAGQDVASAVDIPRLQALGQQALRDRIKPGSPPAEALVTELAGEKLATADRHALAGQLDLFADERVERYWTLLGVLNGWPGREPAVPAVRWWISALRR